MPCTLQSPWNSFRQAKTTREARLSEIMGRYHPPHFPFRVSVRPTPSAPCTRPSLTLEAVSNSSSYSGKLLEMLRYLCMGNEYQAHSLFAQWYSEGLIIPRLSIESPSDGFHKAESRTWATNLRQLLLLLSRYCFWCAQMTSLTESFCTRVLAAGTAAKCRVNSSKIHDKLTAEKDGIASKASNWCRVILTGRMKIRMTSLKLCWSVVQRGKLIEYTLRRCTRMLINPASGLKAAITI